jgi:hypothetical protein
MSSLVPDDKNMDKCMIILSKPLLHIQLRAGSIDTHPPLGTDCHK